MRNSAFCVAAAAMIAGFAALALADDAAPNNALPARAERFAKAVEGWKAKRTEELEKELPRIKRAAIVPSLKQRKTREIQQELKKLKDKKFQPTPVLVKTPTVGDIGTLPRTKGKVREILGENEMIVGLPEIATVLSAQGIQLRETFREVETFYCVRGIATEGLLPRDDLELTQTFEVVSRREYDAPRETVTVPVMEILDETAIREELRKDE